MISRGTGLGRNARVEKRLSMAASTLAGSSITVLTCFVTLQGLQYRFDFFAAAVTLLELLALIGYSVS